MNILFLTDNFPPEVNAPATRTHEHAREWVHAGARVTVITGVPNFPHGRAYPGYRNRLRQIETVDGIRVIRVGTYMARNAGFARRLLDYASFALAAFIAGLFEHADVIVATSPQFFTTWAGAGLGIVRRRPWVFELRDLWPESAIALGVARPGVAMRMMSRIELALYRHAARVVALTPAFRLRLIERGIAADKIAVVPNGANLEVFRPAPAPAPSTRFQIAYVGTPGLAHGLAAILRAMGDLPEADLHIVGHGAAKAGLVVLAARLRLTNVHFTAQIPRAEVPGLIASADAMLVSLRDAPTFRTVIPSKMFEAAAMQKPILLGVDGQARAIMETYRAGLFFAPEDGAAFRAAVRRLIDDPALGVRLGEGGAALARAYDRRRLAAEMLSVLEAVAAER